MYNKLVSDEMNVRLEVSKKNIQVYYILVGVVGRYILFFKTSKLFQNLDVFALKLLIEYLFKNLKEESHSPANMADVNFIRYGELLKYGLRYRLLLSYIPNIREVDIHF